MYWNDLKTNRPDVYQQKLKSNRERIKRLRQQIYSDPEKHAEHKRLQREKYKLRKMKAKSVKPLKDKSELTQSELD